MSFYGRPLSILLVVVSCTGSARAQNVQPTPRHITLTEAVQLALKHNHIVRIAGFKVE
jgi:hypothetical protein